MRDVTPGRFSLQRRRWAYPGAFEVHQDEARARGGFVLSLQHRGCRYVDWRLATRAQWNRELLVVEGELFAAGVRLPRQRWVAVPFGVPLVSSLHCHFVMVGHQRSRRPALRAVAPDDLGGLLERVRMPANASEREGRVADSVAAVTNELFLSPATVDLTVLLHRPERRVSDAAKAYFEQFHATVASWRDYLHYLRLELGVSAFSAGLGTSTTARWLGFRRASSLLHSFAREGLPSPGVLRRAAALAEPASTKQWVTLFAGI